MLIISFLNGYFNVMADTEKLQIKLHGLTFITKSTFLLHFFVATCVKTYLKLFLAIFSERRKQCIGFTDIY